MAKNISLAEGEGFEPPEGSRLQRFSRPPQSTALPPLRGIKTYGGPARGSTGDAGCDLVEIGSRERADQALSGAFKRPRDDLLNASPDRAAAVGRRFVQLEQALALHRPVNAGKRYLPRLAGELEPAMSSRRRFHQRRRLERSHQPTDHHRIGADAVGNHFRADRTMAAAMR